MYFPSAIIHDRHCEWVAQEKQPLDVWRPRLPFPLTSTPAITLSFPCRAEHTMPFLRNSFQTGLIIIQPQRHLYEQSKR